MNRKTMIGLAMLGVPLGILLFYGVYANPRVTLVALGFLGVSVYLYVAVTLILDGLGNPGDCDGYDGY